MIIRQPRAFSTLCLLGLALGASAAARASVINVTDGGLSDWGLFVTTVKNRQTWTPTGSNADGSGEYVHNGLTIYYSVEDYIGGKNGLVDPGYGGQAYDAEALYVTWDADNLYIALVTGHDPDTIDNPGGNTFAAGDFALNFWDGTSDDGSIEFGISTPHFEEDTNLGSGQPPTNLRSNYSADVYRTEEGNDWQRDQYWNTSAVTSLNTNEIATADRVGGATMTIAKLPDRLNIGAGAKSHNHWFYEISVPTSVFGEILSQNSDLNVSWTMNCANDVITVEDDLPTVDEPPVWALLGLTLPLVLARRRRRAAL